jgi:hypothetical protein
MTNQYSHLIKVLEPSLSPPQQQNLITTLYPAVIHNTMPAQSPFYMSKLSQTIYPKEAITPVYATIQTTNLPSGEPLHPHYKHKIIIRKFKKIYFQNERSTVGLDLKWVNSSKINRVLRNQRFKRWPLFNIHLILE